MNNKKVLRKVLLVVICVCGLILFKLPISVEKIPGINIDTNCNLHSWQNVFYPECRNTENVAENQECRKNTKPVIDSRVTIECDCTATSDGRTFHKTYLNELQVDRELTDEEMDCGKWCKEVCDKDAKQYFNR